MNNHRCPDCNGDGYIVATVAAHGCDGTQASCDAICPVAEQEQIQCPTCGGTGVIE